MNSNQRSRISCNSPKVLRILETMHAVPGDSVQSLEAEMLSGSIKSCQALELQFSEGWRNSETTGLAASQNQENLTFGQWNEADFLNPSQVRPDHLMRSS